MLLTHYHHKNDAPFQNLSSLSLEEALIVIANLQKREGSVYSRFKDSKKYLLQRRESENWVRQEFIKKGGQPSSDYPHYFVVEQSVWIEEGFNGQSCSARFPIANFDRKHISFTYPDSMISYWLQSQVGQKFYQPEYHGQVFTMTEISNIIDRFGIPIAEWREDPNRKYDLFIEAQLWTNISL